MTIEEFLKAFPGVPFALHYVERGEAKNCYFGWHASFTSGYWTTDTDRAVYNHNPPEDELGMYEAWGDTAEKALDALARRVLDGAVARVNRCGRELNEAQSTHQSLKAKLGTILIVLLTACSGEPFDAENQLVDAAAPTSADAGAPLAPDASRAFGDSSAPDAPSDGSAPRPDSGVVSVGPDSMAVEPPLDAASASDAAAESAPAPVVCGGYECPRCGMGACCNQLGACGCFYGTCL